MTLVICWLAFPLVMLLLCAGCGLLLERAAATRLPGALIPPAGLAVLILAGQFTTATDATAELIVPLAVLLALAGFAFGDRGRLRHVAIWPLAAAAAVYLAYGAPVLLTGEATFAGYITLDDTATWFALTDRLMEHGRNLAGLPPSTYEAVLDFNLARGYPVGPFLPLGVGRALVGQDVAWVFQPYLSFLAAMLALTLYALTEPVLRSPVRRAIATVIGAQAALLLAYALWGGVKEVLAAALIALVAALAVVPSARTTRRGVLPLAVAIAATVSAMTLTGTVAWLGPLLVVMVTTRLAWKLPRWPLRAWLRLTGATAALTLPWIFGAGVLPPTARPLTAAEGLGNLGSPLEGIQIFGIWPAGDFREDPVSLPLTYMLIGILLLAAVEGLLRAWERRAWPLVSYAIGTLAAAAAIGLLASPWVTAKGLAIASPVALIAALTGTLATVERTRSALGRWAATGAAAAIAAGVLWSNALAYTHVDLAPRDRLAELETIGETIAGQGPTLMTEYEPYGARHFLRDADPEGAAERRRRAVPLRSGGEVQRGNFVELDQFERDALLAYRTLVLRRTPTGSRPPSPYRLVRSDRWYEVWQRQPDDETEIVAHLPLGDLLDPAAPAPCSGVREIAAAAGEEGDLTYVERERPIVVSLTEGNHPGDWAPARTFPHELTPTSSGRVRARFRAPREGRYEVWIGGGIRHRISASVDGQAAGEISNARSYPGHFGLLGSLPLSAGAHEVDLSYDEGGLGPGGDGRPQELGPIVIAPADGKAPRVSRLPAARAERLCGRTLDWIEAIPPR